MALFGKATRIDNLLQERSKLIFEFPTKEAYSTLDRVCPFFENPIITERKSSNLIKYDVLGRTSNQLGFTGAKSKQISVEFNMTLPHIVHMATNELFAQVPTTLTKLEKKQEFFNKKNLELDAKTTGSTYENRRALFLARINGNVGQVGRGHPSAARVRTETSFVRSVLPDADPKTIEQMRGLSVLSDTTTPELDLATDLQAYDKPMIFHQALDMMLFWISLIRMSTLTSRQQPTLGPPIIRLKHGPLYNNVATVAESYSISVAEEAGYDIVSLLPNRVTIQLNLIEIQRNSDVREFTAVEQMDVVKGWDDLLRYDPAYGAGIWEESPFPKM